MGEKPGEKYTFSFTSIAAALPESVMSAGLYLELGDWNSVRAKMLRDNLLQARTVSYAGRLFREISSRLRTLHDTELHLLVNGTDTERRQLIWVAICLRYRPVGDFAREVLVEQYEQGILQLWPDEFERFYLHKIEVYPELTKLSDATIKKAGRVLFRMLKECGLLSGDSDNRMVKQALSTPVMEAIAYDHEKMALFPGGLE